MSDEELDSGNFVGEHTYCIANEMTEKGRERRKGLPYDPCDSSNALAIYEHVDDEQITYDAHCFSCRQNFSAGDIKASTLYGDALDGTQRIAADSPPREAMKRSEIKELYGKTSKEGKMIRGIKDEFNAFFGHRTMLACNGEPLARYYPETALDEDEKVNVVGFKCRNFPKDFTRGKLGITGSKNQLSGQAKFKAGGKYLLIVGGEEDKVAAFQMLREYDRQRGSGDFAPIAVVSPTSGEGSAAKQCARQYEFIDSYDNILIGMDNDPAGVAAAKELCKVLPREKLKIITWTNKDPNKMLEAGMNKQFVRDFYNSKEYVASGIKSSAEIDEEMLLALGEKKVSLPGFMISLEEMMCGGIPLSYIINIIGDTGIGKTEHVNSIILDWVFNSPYKVGVVSLELTAGQYGIAMLSKFVGKNLLRFKTPAEALEFVNKPHIQKKREELWTDEYGNPRWSLLDERDGSVEGLQKQVEKLINQHGCKLIVIDVLSDLLEGCSNEEQGLHMKWQKGIVKGGVTIVNIVHSRKPPSSKDGKVRKVTEYDAYGSSTIVKSAGANVILHRDKMEEDMVLRNTTEVELSKCRWSGLTGHAGDWYYDGLTRQTYDKETYFNSEPKAIESTTIPDQPLLGEPPVYEDESYIGEGIEEHNQLATGDNS